MSHQPATVRRPRKKSYHWFCVDNSFPGHKKWRYIAGVLDLHLCFVQSVTLDLLAYANKNDNGKKRGSLEGWSAFDCAGACNLNADDCARIYAMLEETGWIIDDYIVNFDEHQFTGEHPDAVAARKRRQRNLEKDQRRALQGLPPREKQERPPVDGDKIAAQYWLQTTGKDILIGRLGMRALAAEATIARWQKELDGNAQDVQDIIRSAVQENLDGEKFQNVVGQRIASMRRLKAGPMLPLGSMADGGRPTVLQGGKADAAG